MAERNLPRIPTIEEARAQVEAEWRKDYEDALEFHSKQIVSRVADIHRQAEREELSLRKRQAEADEAAKLAKRAWVKQYGAKLADQIDPWSSYRVVPWQDKHVAVLEENAELTASLAVTAGIDTSGQQHTGVRGIHLTKFAPALAAVNPTPAQIEEVGQRLAAARQRDHEAQRKRDDREKQLHRERQLLGVTVSE